MTLRARLAAAAGLAVTVVLLVVATTVYFADRSQLRGQVDQSLRDFASQARTERQQDVRERRDGRPDHDPPPRSYRGRFGGPGAYTQLVTTRATGLRPPQESEPLPIDARVRKVARSGRGAFFEDVHVGGTHLRVYTVPAEPGHAIQLARPLTETDHSLSRLLVILAAVGFGGVLLALITGGIVARAALAPVSAFTRRTEVLAATPVPEERLTVGRRDELGRLAASINAILDALTRSLEAQRHLIADASHELRTPMASLRANVQILFDADRLSISERESLRRDVLEELDALADLVGDVVDLARDATPEIEPDDIPLHVIVEASVETARRRSPELEFVSQLSPAWVPGTASRMSRAVANALDNAAKWSPAGSTVAVTLKGGELTVCDSGPGFPPEALPYVFDRFYRAEGARRLPGSGLGLAIVRQAAEAHGGYVLATNQLGGGAKLQVSFGNPMTPPPAALRDESPATT